MEEQNQSFESRLELGQLSAAAERVRGQMGQVIVGQEQMLQQILVAILADGHILIEGVPGVAKTLAAKLVARSISAGFSRIQFTPDLMPSDVTGTTLFNAKTSAFEFRPGPIFSNIVLIDEINRAPAKTQASLFEVMEERQVTVDGKTYPMAPPFMVLATQNPIEQEGTYRLPEAQLDRFLLKLEVGYPGLEEEVEILNRQEANAEVFRLERFEPVLTVAQIVEMRQLVRQVKVEANLRRYIAQVVHRTRNNPALYLGASPRASLALMATSKALAALRGRDFVTPEDVKEMAPPVLRHRVLLTAEKEMEGLTASEVVRRVVESVEIPR